MLRPKGWDSAKTHSRDMVCQCAHGISLRRNPLRILRTSHRRLPLARLPRGLRRPRRRPPSLLRRSGRVGCEGRTARGARRSIFRVLRRSRVRSVHRGPSRHTWAGTLCTTLPGLTHHVQRGRSERPCQAHRKSSKICGRHTEELRRFQEDAQHVMSGRPAERRGRSSRRDRSTYAARGACAHTCLRVACVVFEESARAAVAAYEVIRVGARVDLPERVRLVRVSQELDG